MIELNEKEILTSEDVSRMLGISPHEVRRLAKRKQVGRQITRGTWLFTLKEVNALKGVCNG